MLTWGATIPYVVAANALSAQALLSNSALDAELLTYSYLSCLSTLSIALVAAFEGAARSRSGGALDSSPLLARLRTSRASETGNATKVCWRLLLVWLISAPLVTRWWAQSTAGASFSGPSPSSIFQSLGVWASWGIPAAILAATLGAMGVQRRSIAWAFGGVLVVQTATTCAASWRIGLERAWPATVAWVRVGQANCIAAAALAIGLLWLARRLANSGRLQQDEQREASANSQIIVLRPLYEALATAACTFCGATLIGVGPWLFWSPTPPPWILASGSLLGWGSLGCAAACAAPLVPRVREGRPRERRPEVGAAGAVGMALGVVLATATAARWDRGNWFAFHILLAGSLVGAWALPQAGAWAVRRRRHGRSGLNAALGYGAAFATAAAALALRTLDNGPSAPLWAVGAFGLLGLWAWRCGWLASARIGCWVGAGAVHTSLTL